MGWDGMGWDGCNKYGGVPKKRGVKKFFLKKVGGAFFFKNGVYEGHVLPEGVDGSMLRGDIRYQNFGLEWGGFFFFQFRIQREINKRGVF